MPTDTRRVPRYPFFASAEITERKSETRLIARTSELSRYGCYMDMMNPLPLDTAVRIVIVYHDQSFSANGSVIYSQPNMGMGISFEMIDAGQQAIIEKWLTEMGVK
jgi:hypothetical protein